MNNLLRKLALLCVVAGALFVGETSAAMKASDVLDGNYYSQSEGGRGVSILFAPHADGSSTFFGVIFTYDDAGEPTWLEIYGDFLENQFENTQLTVARVTGGAFGFPFDAGAIVEDPIGTATVTLNSCTNIFIDLDMDPDSGFPDVTLGNLQPVDGPAPTCVYTEEFAGCPALS